VSGGIYNRGCDVCVIKKKAEATYLDVRKPEIGGRNWETKIHKY
jgi:hypothetical protein